MKNIYFIILTCLIFLYIFIEVRKKKFNIKESFYWMVAAFLMIILSIWPHIIDWLAGLFGISYPPSLFFVFCILFLIFINFRSSKKISELSMKVTELEQNMTLLRGKIKDEKK